MLLAKHVMSERACDDPLYSTSDHTGSARLHGPREASAWWVVALRRGRGGPGGEPKTPKRGWDFL